LFRSGEKTRLPDGVLRESVKITQSGTPEGYHLVTPPENGKTSIDVMNAEDYTLVIDADYVIVRGLELRNAARHGIYIPKKRHHIVIEDCHITFWGRIGGPITYGNEGNMDSAIYAEQGCARLVIQRNLIDHPRGASNDWDTGHPAGPQGISLNNSSGGNVIRYNELRATEDHGFNDGIGGGSNFSTEGSPNRDSDIHGNVICHLWDDGIESEGANQNVRIWGNYIHHTYQHVATACTSKGPLYIFRNLFGLSRRTQTNPLGGSMIKLGERDAFGGGRIFVFHNTGLQPNGAFNVFSSHHTSNIVTRNNIFDCPGQLVSSRESTIPSDFDYDLFTGSSRGVAKEEHGKREKPAYIHSDYLEFYPASTTTKIEWGRVEFEKGDRTITITDPVVPIPNPMRDGGTPIPNFNDDFQGKAPDLGAFEMGCPPLRFGRQADPAFQWAPWETR
ncbi:MAG: right-handed parallel beta-helix repeat-containing protein, partial [bacterium]|nr:right-handed parallel beta-helix repeat-containing protein [bacterium]